MGLPIPLEMLKIYTLMIVNSIEEKVTIVQGGQKLHRQHEQGKRVST